MDHVFCCKQKVYKLKREQNDQSLVLLQIRLATAKLNVEILYATQEYAEGFLQEGRRELGVLRVKIYHKRKHGQNETSQYQRGLVILSATNTPTDLRRNVFWTTTNFSWEV